MEEEEKEEKISQLQYYQQPLQAFLRRVCWGRIDFLKGSIFIYSWYRYL